MTTSLLKLITPTNLLAERDKFLASRTYHPTFKYTWQDEDIAYNPDHRANLWEAIKEQDNLGITRAAAKLFEVEINDHDLATANAAASTKGILSQGEGATYAALLVDALKFFNLENVRVVLTDEAGFNARPSHKQNLIQVSRHIHFDYFSMEGGVRHELVHVLRYHNGRFNQIKRTPNYLPTEEGLASWCQDNTNDDNGFAQHAMEYVASSVGVGGSLRDIYECLRDLGMSSDLAWKRASRHKFGFIDTSKPGDIMKPAMYFAGEIKVGELKTDEKLRLFMGKFAMSDLASYPQYQGLWPAQQLISYFKL